MRNDPGLWEPSAEMRRARRLCAEAFGVPELRMLGKSRIRDIAQARQATCYVVRAVWPHLSYPCIGALMGGVDHSTVIHSCRVVAARMERDPALLGKVRALIALLGAGRREGDADSHVRAWRAYRAEMAARRPSVAMLFGPDSELAEFASADRMPCPQCDRAVSAAEAARCRSARCGLKAAERMAA